MSSFSGASPGSPRGCRPPATPSSSCLGLFPPPLSSPPCEICEFDSVLMPCSAAPSPRPAQLAAMWPRDPAGAASAVATAACAEGSVNRGNRRSSGGDSFSLSARSAFLLPRKDETRRRRMRKAVKVWMERGLFSALEELARATVAEDEGEGKEGGGGLWDRMVGSAAGAILAVLRVLTNLNASFNPHLTMSGEDMIHRFSETRDWLSSRVRCIAWHPRAPKFALALRDDTVQVHGLSLPTSPVLKYKQQRGVACLAWKPHSSGELAVGCLTGLLVWTVDPTSVAARPSASSVVQLTAKGHAPVTGLQWDPKGKHLLSCSAADTSMILWNTASETKTPLRRVGGGGVHLVAWSPSSLFLPSRPSSSVVAATPSTVFRIWETRTWSHETWNVLSGHVQSACWSPSGSHLLFATSTEPVVYALDLASASSSASASASASAIPLADFSAVAYDSGDGEEIILGGLIQSLRWDPLGERLAISFQDSDAVALFCTSESPTLTLSPIGLIRGTDDGERPSCMEFAGSAFDEGAMLTIAWSSGRLQYVPLLFVPNVQNVSSAAPIVLDPDLDLSLLRGGEQDGLPQGRRRMSPQLFSPRPKDG